MKSAATYHSEAENILAKFGNDNDSAITIQRFAVALSLAKWSCDAESAGPAPPLPTLS